MVRKRAFYSPRVVFKKSFLTREADLFLVPKTVPNYDYINDLLSKNLIFRDFWKKGGGGAGIRTLDRLLTYAGFQDRCIQPLCHPSVSFEIGSSETFYRLVNIERDYVTKIIAGSYGHDTRYGLQVSLLKGIIALIKVPQKNSTYICLDFRIS